MDETDLNASVWEPISNDELDSEWLAAQADAARADLDAALRRQHAQDIAMLAAVERARDDLRASMVPRVPSARALLRAERQVIEHYKDALAATADEVARRQRDLDRIDSHIADLADGDDDLPDGDA